MFSSMSESPSTSTSKQSQAEKGFTVDSPAGPIPKKPKHGTNSSSEGDANNCASTFASANPNLGDIPQELFKDNLKQTVTSPSSIAESSFATSKTSMPPDAAADSSHRNLSSTMKEETCEFVPASKVRPETIYIDSSSSSDDDDRTVVNFNTHGTSSRCEIYGYQYACKYLATAHFGKYGPFSLDKCYDKIFMDNLDNSFDVKKSLNKSGQDDPSLMCNRLKIHSYRKMKDEKTNGAKTFTFKNGSRGYYFVFVRIFTKEEKRAGMNSLHEMHKWMDAIRKEYVNTPCQYPVKMDKSVVLGSSLADKRTVDRLLLDMDVVEYARLIHGSKAAKPKYSKLYFSEERKGAKDLLG